MTFQSYNNKEYLHLGTLPDHYCYLFLIVDHVPENNKPKVGPGIIVLMRVMERQQNPNKRLLWVFPGPWKILQFLL